ncbi:MAG: PqqD family protein [Erythrobacter sp.]
MANFIETDVDGEVLIVDLDGGELFSLSGTAREIWRLIDGRRTENEIAAVLADRFDAPARRITDDVVALVERLVQTAMVSLK